MRSVSLPAAGTYGTGSALSFKVTFNEPVLVVGDQTAVSLPVEVGYGMREAQYVSGSGTPSLTFRMAVRANDVDADGISLGRVNTSAVRDFDFAENQILDRAGNPASNVIPAVNTSRILNRRICNCRLDQQDFSTGWYFSIWWWHYRCQSSSSMELH